MQVREPAELDESDHERRVRDREPGRGEQLVVEERPRLEQEEPGDRRGGDEPVDDRVELAAERARLAETPREEPVPEVEEERESETDTDRPGPTLERTNPKRGQQKCPCRRQLVRHESQLPHQLAHRTPTG